jgi:hypothetical protein
MSSHLGRLDVRRVRPVCAGRSYRRAPAVEDLVSGEEPRRVGPWVLEEKLGSGGNATVWRARRDGQGPIALKVLNSTKVQREPYGRFVNEITVLRNLGDEPGVLKLLDFNLPEQPSGEDRAWLAMPIAAPIGDALQGEPVESVVAGMGEIAGTLARLRAEHQIGHRDVKPANLYAHEGRFLVGDFGLVAAPDLDELTREGRPLGPAHYLAYEMLLNAAGADPGPADVYSLGKTLWVLATGQAYPPHGHQPASTRGFSIADQRPHAHADALDRLVDRCTRLDPQSRPTMEQVAEDLSGWAQLQAGSGTVDFSDLRGQLRERLSGEIAQKELAATQQEAAAEAARMLEELLAPLDEALKSLHGDARLAQMPDHLSEYMLKSLDELDGVEIVWRWARVSELAAGPAYERYSLRVGRGVELTAAGELLIHAFVDVGRPELSGGDFYWPMPSVSAPVGSVEAEVLLRRVAGELEVQTRLAVEAFVAHVPTLGGEG